MDSQRVMTIAEKLYQNGFVSYPRTETDQFDPDMNLDVIIEKQVQSPDWGNFAQGLRNGGFSRPRAGRNNDKAHPPIHPVNFAANNTLDAEHRRVYEFIVRRFLACCAHDAKGTKTDISILYGTETFNASGLMVLERNYLDVYPYDKWTSSQELPIFTDGEVFVPTEARMHEGETTPPGYLTEPELIGLMDANGIGTDATMAEHIAKIKEREYVMARARGRAPARAGQFESEDEYEADDGPADRGRGRGGRGGRGRGGRGGRGGGCGGANAGGGGNGGVQEFIPTTLGVALIEGYESMGFDISLAKPFLRKEVRCQSTSTIIRT
jgi:DNA topoisomerase-3